MLVSDKGTRVTYCDTADYEELKNLLIGSVIRHETVIKVLLDIDRRVTELEKQNVEG